MGKNNIKIKLRLLIILSVIFVVLIGILMIRNKSNTQEQKLSKKIEEVGSDFYENMYYGHIVSNKSDEEVKEFFSNFVEIGIKVDLDNLSRYNEEKYPNLVEEFVNSKTEESCHIRNTKAIIYPKEPFGNKDYSIEAQLDCGFEVEDN